MASQRSVRRRTCSSTVAAAAERARDYARAHRQDGLPHSPRGRSPAALCRPCPGNGAQGRSLRCIQVRAARWRWGRHRTHARREDPDGSRRHTSRCPPRARPPDTLVRRTGPRHARPGASPIRPLHQALQAPPVDTGMGCSIVRRTSYLTSHVVHGRQRSQWPGEARALVRRCLACRTMGRGAGAVPRLSGGICVGGIVSPAAVLSSSLLVLLVSTGIVLLGHRFRCTSTAAPFCHGCPPNFSNPIKRPHPNAFVRRLSRNTPFWPQRTVGWLRRLLVLPSAAQRISAARWGQPEYERARAGRRRQDQDSPRPAVPWQRENS